MGRDLKKREKARQRKLAKRKQKRASRPAQYRPHPLLASAGRWPLHEVLLTEGWQKEGQGGLTPPPILKIPANAAPTP